MCSYYVVFIGVGLASMRQDEEGRWEGKYKERRRERKEEKEHLPLLRLGSDYVSVSFTGI